MIWWHHLVEIKRIKELALSTLLPPHHRPLPRIATSIRRNHGSSIVSMRVLQLLQHNRPESGHYSAPSRCPRLPRTSLRRLPRRDRNLQRRDRKLTRSSSEKTCGCSQAAKCVPLEKLL